VEMSMRLTFRSCKIRVDKIVGPMIFDFLWVFVGPKNDVLLVRVALKKVFMLRHERHCTQSYVLHR